MPSASSSSSRHPSGPVAVDRPRARVVRHQYVGLPLRRRPAPRPRGQVSTTTLARDADPDHRRGGDARPGRVRGRGGAGHDVRGAAAGRARHHRLARAVRRRRVATAPGRGRQLRGLDRRRRRRDARTTRRSRSTAPAPATSRAAAAAAGAWTSTCRATTCSTVQARPRTSSPTRSGRCPAYGRSKLAGERAVAAAAPESHTIVRSSWLFGERRAVLPEDDPAARRRARSSCASSTTRSAARRSPATSRRRCVRLCRAADAGGRARRRRRRSARGTSSRGRSSRRPVSTVDVLPGRDGRSGAPRAAPRLQRLRTERGDRCRDLPDWHDGLAAFMRRRVVASDEAARLRRRRVHRLDVRAPAAGRARRRGHRARQADLRGAAGEPRTT